MFRLAARTTIKLNPGLQILRRVALGLGFAVALAGAGTFGVPAQARQETRGQAVAVRALPPEAARVLALIRRGGPFPYTKDGAVFGNYEHLLPLKRRGYYREYTVPTPASRDRGARRIICGGARRSPDVCYYTHDHYSSFQPIAR